MAEEKKPYRVVQQGRDGAPLEIEGQLVSFNDTIWLTKEQAKYRIGLSIEPAFPQEPATPVGEHREKSIDVQEDTRPMKVMQAHEEDVRSTRRPARSKTAKEG
jgi:hypothetical protein